MASYFSFLWPGDDDTAIASNAYLTSTLSLFSGLQKRLLQFIFRRIFNGIARDNDSLQHVVDLGNGTVSVHNLQLDAGTITAKYLAGTGVELIAGAVGLIKVEVAMPLTLSSTVNIQVQDVSLTVRAAAVAGTHSLGQEPSELHERVIEMAEEFVKEAHLAESAPELAPEDSTLFSQQIPGGFGASETADEEDQVTLIASIVEKLLQRLSVSIRDVVVDASVDAGPTGRASSDFRATLAHIASPSPSLSASQGVSSRRISLSAPQVFIRAGEPASAAEATPAAFDSDTSTDTEDDMVMSRSIQDLRSGQSMYHSIYQSALAESEAEGGMFVDPDAPLSSSPTPEPSFPPTRLTPPSEPPIPLVPSSPTAMRQERFSKILSFGDSDVSINMSLSKEGDSLKSSLSVSVPQSISIMLTTDQLARVFDTVHVLSERPTPLAPPPAPDPSKKRAKEAHTKLEICQVNCILVYDPSCSAVDAKDTEFFWKDPGVYAVAPSHIRLRIDKISVKNADSLRRLQLIVNSFRISEHFNQYHFPLIQSDPSISTSYDVNDTPDLSSVKLKQEDWTQIPERKHRQASTNAVVVDLVFSRKAVVQLSPVAVFADLTILNRLSPCLAFLSNLALFSRPDGAIQETAQTAKPSAFKTEVLLSMLRLAVRCPGPDREDPVENIPALRSGILTVDIHSIDILSSQGLSGLRWSQLLIFMLPVGETEAPAFLNIMFGTDTLMDESVILNTTQSTILPNASMKKPRIYLGADKIVDIKMPNTRVALNKMIFDQIQYFLDDIDRWMAGSILVPCEMQNENVSSSMMSTRSDQTIKKPNHRDSSAFNFDNEQDSLPLRVRVSFQLINVSLDLSLSDNGEDAPNPALTVQVEDLTSEITIVKTPNSNVDLTTTIRDVSVKANSDGECILCRSKGSTNNEVLRLSFASVSDVLTGAKLSRINVFLSELTCLVVASTVQDLTTDLLGFLKAPEGVFETVVPTELMSLSVRLQSVSVVLKPDLDAVSTTQGQLVVYLGELGVKTDISTKIEGMVLEITLNGLRMLGIGSADDIITEKRPGKPMASAYEHWKVRGFVPLLRILQTSVSVSLRSPSSDMSLGNEMHISNTILHLSLCADSADAINETINKMMELLINPSNSDPGLSTVSGSTEGSSPTSSRDILESLDSLSFHERSAERAHGRRGVSPSGSDTKPEGIWTKYEGGLNVIDRYVDDVLLSRSQSEKSAPQSMFRCRFDTIRVIIDLHDGYEWHKTRKAIEDERKRIRKRLEKIRQLLANGQVADSTVEEVSALLLHSAGGDSSSPDGGAFSMSTTELIEAIDEELNGASIYGQSEDMTQRASTVASSVADFDDDTSTVMGVTHEESWQALGSSPHKAAVPPGVPPKTDIAKRSLKRSKDHVIRINLNDISGQYDQFEESLFDSVSSKLQLSVDSLRILDNLSSSTWNRFLTELRSTNGSTLRPTGSSMARIEVSTYRSDNILLDSEVAMKIKLCPLRLYVDQDALDFLKAFAAGPPVGKEKTKPSDTPFFQRVEIYPVKLKLDYKPKRVDYMALKQGKTIELMNFFHFEGSEITLRHLVVTGVSGGARLSDLVQDIWTPDVKANQIGDILAGIEPFKSMINLGSGVANLVLMPIEQYQKDGRIIRGIQRGVNSFAKTTTLEALNVGAKLATRTQVILEYVESAIASSPEDKMHVVAPGEGQQQYSRDITPDQIFDSIILEPASGGADVKPSRYANPPTNIREGVQLAYKSLQSNLRIAAQTILSVPMEVYERSGQTSQEQPVHAVVKAVPVAVLKPMIGASEAVSNALLGLKNTLDPNAQADASDKYK